MATLAILGAVFLLLPLAGLIVVIMQTGGEALERYAEGRALFAVRALEAAAPRIAHRVHDGEIDDIPVSEIVVGDHLLVRPGGMLPLRRRGHGRPLTRRCLPPYGRAHPYFSLAWHATHERKFEWRGPAHRACECARQ